MGRLTRIVVSDLLTCQHLALVKQDKMSDLVRLILDEYGHT